MEKEKNEKKIKLADIKKQMHEQETAAERLRNRISAVEQEYQSCMSKIETLDNNNSVEPKEIEKNMKEGAALQEKADSFKESIKRLKNALNETEKQAAVLQSEFNKVSREVSLDEAYNIINAIPRGVIQDVRRAYALRSNGRYISYEDFLIEVFPKPYQDEISMLLEPLREMLG